jgi:hypothetical protein
MGVVFALGFVLLFVPTLVANAKGRSVPGFILLSLIFWPLALYLALTCEDISRDGRRRRKIELEKAAQQRGRRYCPDCNESIPADATVCEFCKVILPN